MNKSDIILTRFESLIHLKLTSLQKMIKKKLKHDGSVSFYVRQNCVQPSAVCLVQREKRNKKLLVISGNYDLIL